MKQETTNRARRLADAVKQITGRGVSHAQSLRILAAVEGLRNEHVLAAHDKLSTTVDLATLIEHGSGPEPFKAALDAVLDEAIHRNATHILIQAAGELDRVGVWFRQLGHPDTGVGGINPDMLGRFMNYAWNIGCTTEHVTRGAGDGHQERLVELKLCKQRGLYGGAVTRQDNGDYLLMHIYRTRAESIGVAIARWCGEAVRRGDVEAFRTYQSLWSSMGNLPLGTSELPAAAALLAGVRLDATTQMIANDEAKKALMGGKNALAVVVDAWCGSDHAGIHALGDAVLAKFEAK